MKAAKSTHEYSIRSLALYAAYIRLNEFGPHEMRPVCTGQKVSIAMAKNVVAGGDSLERQAQLTLRLSTACAKGERE